MQRLKGFCRSMPETASENSRCLCNIEGRATKGDGKKDVLCSWGALLSENVFDENDVSNAYMVLKVEGETRNTQ